MDVRSLARGGNYIYIHTYHVMKMRIGTVSNIEISKDHWSSTECARVRKVSRRFLPFFSILSSYIPSPLSFNLLLLHL